MRSGTILGVLGYGLLSGAAVLGGHGAADAADFYKGKTFTIVVGYPGGSGYDRYARTFGRYVSKHLAGEPVIVVKNMQGATSLVAAKYIFHKAPRDGTEIGMIGRGIATEGLLRERDPKTALSPEQVKSLGWIGSANQEAAVCYVWHATGIASIKDATKQVARMGSTGPGSDYETNARVLNAALGTKFQIIRGYPGPRAVTLAVEQQELDGVCGVSWSSLLSSKPEWLKQKKINLLVQTGLKKHQDLPDLPLILDLAGNKTERGALELIFTRNALGRPLVAPPDLPKARLAELRAAFDATMSDSGYVAEATKSRLEVNPLAGTEVEKLIARAYSTPQAVVDRAVAIIGGSH